MEIKIKNKTLKLLVKKMFIGHPNLDQLVDMLFLSCPDNIIASMLDIMLTEETYVPFTKGAWVLVNLEGYQRREIENHDALRDLKLMDKDLFIGYIKDSSNYGDEFEPYNGQMKVAVFTCKHSKEVNEKVIDVHSTNLSLIHDLEAQASLNDIKNNLLV